MRPLVTSRSDAHWRFASRLVRPEASRLFLLFLMTCSSTALVLANPQIIRSFIDTAKSGWELDTLLHLSFAFIGVVCVQQMIATLQNYTADVVGWNTTNSLRSSLFRHCLRLDLSFHHQHSAGYLMERIDGDVNELSGFLSLFFVQIVGNVLLLVGTLAFFFYFDWRLGAVFLVFSAASLAALWVVRNVAVPYIGAYREQTGRLFGFLEEHLAGADDIRTNRASHFSFSRLKSHYSELRKRWRISNLTILIGRNLVIVVSTVGHILAVAASYYLFVEEKASIGVAYLIVHYVRILLGPLQSIGSQIEQLQTGLASIRRVQGLLATSSAIPTDIKPADAKLPEGPAAVELRDVCFGFSEDSLTLRDISFELPPGETLGVMGITGAGKTTLGRLILRLYEPRSGMIRLGGVDAHQLSPEHLRQRVHMAPQEPHIFHASIRENLTLYDRTIDDAAIAEALSDFRMDQWVHELESGLDTVVAPEQLSAGQSQLIGLARFFLRRPSVVVLDEPTSKLDLTTEDHVENAITRLAEIATCIVISHKARTLERAHRVLILEDGGVGESGEVAELRRNPASKFSQLSQNG